MVITADTHVPKRARDLPGPLWQAIGDADVVVHETGPRTGRRAQPYATFLTARVTAGGSTGSNCTASRHARRRPDPPAPRTAPDVLPGWAIRAPDRGASADTIIR